MGRWPAAEPPSDVEGPDADPEQVARTILLRRLDAAPRTRSQLFATLRDRGVPDDVAGRVLDRFEEVGLIDDRLYARMWVESRQAGRGLSARALRVELRTRGVAEELISEALEGVSRDAERESARTIAERKYRSVAGLPYATQVRRIAGALARKGYDAGLTAQVVREVLDRSADEAGDQTPDQDQGWDRADPADPGDPADPADPDNGRA